MSVIARGTTKAVKIVYPPGCKEVTEELGKDELVRRLKLIARAFQDMGQDDNEQFTGLALHLATDFFLEHQNKDVRLLVACCIADVFRIFAPEAPFRDASHLKDIFMFLNKQLRGLENPNSPTFKRYFYLLENLAWVKSFNICIELDDSQEIFCSLFKLMFSVINEKHTSKVKNFMIDMMTPLLTEADVVSQELLDILLLNVVEPHKSQNRQAYCLAKELLIRASNAIEPYVQQFFNNALMLGKTSESELSEHLYDLIYELNAIAPTVLLSVLPQLEFKLKSNEESERKQVTKILSKMFSDPGSNLAEQNKPLWNCFLGRFNDISITVRTICVQSAVNFVLNHPELVKDVIEQVKIRQHDAEETVRIEVVNTLLNIARKNFDITTPEMLDVIKERTRDKRFKIRRDALNGLGQLYKSITNMDPVSQDKLKKIVWVKDKVFHAYYQQNPEDRLLVERIFNICLVPYQLPPDERMKRLYQLYATLDEPATKAFHEMMKYRHTVRTCVKYLLDGLDRMTANPREHVVFLPKIQQLARTLPDQQKALEQVKKLNELMRDDRRLRLLMRYLVSPDCNCRKANDNVRDILQKLGGGNANCTQSQILLYNNTKSLLERVAPVMVDSNAMSMLVKHVEDAVKGQGTIADGIIDPGEKGAQLLLCMSGVFPHYFKGEDTFDSLISFLKDEDEIVADITLQVFANCGLGLETESPEIFSKLLPILQHTARIGNPKQAKHALRCINSIVRNNKESALSQVFDYVKDNLKPESANYITSIVALGHISYMCPEEFSQSMKTIVSKDIVKDLLMQDRTHGQPVMDSWYGDHLVTEETNAKIQAMKLLMRWLLGLKSNVNNSCTSTLRLFYTVIVHEGDLMEKGLINKPELARLRLQAGCAILKLAEEPVFADLLQREQFQALALLINDSCYHVRVKFADKLHKGLFALKLPLEFMSIFSLAANDPVRERRTCIKRYIQLNIQRRRDFLKQNTALGGKMYLYLPDYAMPYTVHLLAHDPDLKSFDDVQALKNIKECLWFIMEPLVSRSEEYNYQFFRRLIENIKQAKDAQGPEDEDTNKKLYAVCDLALGLLQKNLTNIVLKDENVDPVLPCKLFTKPEKGSINTTVYLPKDFNFEKKKGLIDPTQVNTNQGTFYKRKQDQQPTLETIIVESPGPVVNPHPTCPREPNVKKKKLKLKDDSSETSETPDAEEKTQKKTGKVRGKRVTSEQADNVSESGESEVSTEAKSPTPVKKGGRGKGKNVKANKKGDATKNETTDDSSVNSGGDSVEEMETSQEVKDSSSQDTESATPPPPKKRILKRTVAEAIKQSAQQATAKKGRKKSSDTQEKSNEEEIVPEKSEKKAPQKKGKGVINGENKKTKAAKRTVEESDSDKSEDSTTPKKRKFNLEKDAVPAPKLGKKAAAGNKRKKSQDEEVESNESTSRPSTPEQASQDSNFKSPGSPAPKATPKRGTAKGKAGTRGTSKSPVSSTSSTTSSQSSPATKTTSSKKQTAGKSPKPSAKVNVTNVRKAKPLSNGTEGSSKTTGKKAKATALLKAIQKGNLNKDGKKGAGKKK
ncbi:Sister chromatid cohesion protein PDS5 A [Mactra antiquata]